MGGSISASYGTLVDTLNEEAELVREEKDEGIKYRRPQVYCKSAQPSVTHLTELMERAEEHVFDNEELVEERLNTALRRHMALFRPVECSVMFELFKMALVKEDFDEPYACMQSEGLNARKMSIVEKGKAHMSLRKHPVRSLKAPVTYTEWLAMGGDSTTSLDCGPYGEMELLFDVPATPNLRATTKHATLWSLYRHDYQRVVAMVEKATVMQRMRWLRRCPEMAVLDDCNLMRLVQNLEVENYQRGDRIMQRKRMTSRFVMIERGECIVSLPAEVIPREGDFTRAEMDRQLSIVRPPGLDTLRCVHDMNPHMLLRYMTYVERLAGDMAPKEDDSGKSTLVEVTVDELENKGELDGEEGSSTAGAGEGPLPGERIAHDPYTPALPEHTMLVTSGCIFGIDALRSKIRQGQIEFWQWMPNHYTDEMYSEPVRDDGQSYPGSEVPYTMVAKTDVQVVSFSVDLLDRIFPSVDAFTRGDVPMYDSDGEKEIICSARRDEEDKGGDDAKEEGKDEQKCEQIDGQIAEQKEEQALCSKYVIKTFPLTEEGEAAFAVERRLLSGLARTLFFPRLASNAQHLPPLSPRGLTLVTNRSAVRGDLWRLIHAPPDRIPHTYDNIYLANFYFAQVLVALTSLHERKLAWRGVCPENIGIDEQGNTVLLDISMCGDVSNERRTGERRSTLCGLPEYMAPEMILGTGHGQAVDMWSMGVMLHELYWGHTPFCASKKDRGKVYNNEALKVEAVLRSTLRWEQSLAHTCRIAKGDPTEAPTMAAILINKLVRGNPAQRLGYLHPNGPMHVIDCTNLFDALELDLLISGRLSPPFHIPYV
jgi:CRP-like cAMP-binding protein